MGQSVNRVMKSFIRACIKR